MQTRYKVGDVVDVVWCDQQKRWRRLPGEIIGLYSTAGTWRYRVRLDDGRAILCWPHQLRAGNDMPLLAS